MTVDGSIEEVTQATANAVATELNVTVSNVIVTYDSESNTATYNIVSDDYTTLIDFESSINDANFVANLNANMGDTLTITSAIAPTVNAEVSVTMNASDVDDVDAAISEATTYFTDNSFTSVSSGDNISKFF